jgi:hypothetical protein
MKSGMSILLAGILCAAVTNNDLYGQPVKADLLNRNTLVFIDGESLTNPESPSHKRFGPRRVNPKALRDFLEEYKDFDSVRWYQSDKGSVASFILDEVEIITSYDKYGNRTSKRKVYKENKLPSDVRRLVKREYYDYEITSVIEIINPDQTIYVVTMEDKTRVVQVKVTDLEMELVIKFFKSK